MGKPFWRLVWEILGLCLTEGLIPRADYEVRVRCDDGWGLCRYRVRLAVSLASDARTRVAELLGLALTPWNRSVGGEAGPQPMIRVEVATGP